MKSFRRDALVRSSVGGAEHILSLSVCSPLFYCYVHDKIFLIVRRHLPAEELTWLIRARHSAEVPGSSTRPTHPPFLPTCLDTPFPSFPPTFRSIDSGFPSPPPVSGPAFISLARTRTPPEHDPIANADANSCVCNARRPIPRDKGAPGHRRALDHIRPRHACTQPRSAPIS